MSKIIYKWGPVVNDPIGIKGDVIHVGYQNTPSGPDVFVWTELVIGNDTPEWYVSLYPTGCAYEGEYHGTVVLPSGLVWHVIGCE